MTDTATPEAPKPDSPSKSKGGKAKYTVFPLPKIVFFYPLTIACIVCYILEAMNGEAYSANAGVLFIAMFLLNVVVISFDFSGVKIFAILGSALALVFGLLYLKAEGLIPGAWLDWLLEQLKFLLGSVHGSEMMYLMVFAILFFMIGAGILNNFLWNRWTIEPNRLIHKHGILGDYREYPVIDLQVEKKIEDVLEYALLLSGTLIFQPGPSIPTIRLENVPLINRVEKKILEINRKHNR